MKFANRREAARRNATRRSNQGEVAKRLGQRQRTRPMPHSPPHARCPNHSRAPRNSARRPQGHFPAVPNCFGQRGCSGRVFRAGAEGWQNLAHSRFIFFPIVAPDSPCSASARRARSLCRLTSPSSLLRIGLTGRPPRTLHSRPPTASIHPGTRCLARLHCPPASATQVWLLAESATALGAAGPRTPWPTSRRTPASAPSCRCGRHAHSPSPLGRAASRPALAAAAARASLLSPRRHGLPLSSSHCSRPVRSSAPSGHSSHSTRAARAVDPSTLRPFDSQTASPDHLGASGGGPPRGTAATQQPAAAAASQARSNVISIMPSAARIFGVPSRIHADSWVDFNLSTRDVRKGGRALAASPRRPSQPRPRRPRQSLFRLDPLSSRQVMYEFAAN